MLCISTKGRDIVYSSSLPYVAITRGQGAVIRLFRHQPLELVIVPCAP